MTWDSKMGRLASTPSFFGWDYTPVPKTNIFAPENGGPLEKEIPNLETIIFRGELLVSGRVMKQSCTMWWNFMSSSLKLRCEHFIVYSLLLM